VISHHQNYEDGFLLILTPSRYSVHSTLEP
jgi:hypothetical protein